MFLTCLPRRVSQCLRVLGPCFRHRHQLVFSWLLVLPLVYGERANLKALARHGPQHLAYQHYRRLLYAAYWCTKTWLWWFTDQALMGFAYSRLLFQTTVQLLTYSALPATPLVLPGSVHSP
jgi:hypothetical protein